MSDIEGFTQYESQPHTQDPGISKLRLLTASLESLSVRGAWGGLEAALHITTVGVDHVLRGKSCLLLSAHLGLSLTVHHLLAWEGQGASLPVTAVTY